MQIVNYMHNCGSYYKLGTDNTREETPIQLNKMFCGRYKEQGTGLKVTFDWDLAKHAPLGLYYLMRIIASGDGASVQ